MVSSPVPPMPGDGARVGLQDTMSGAEGGDRYPLLLRTARRRWWRPPLGLLLASAVLAVMGAGVVLAALLASSNAGSPGGAGEAIDPATPLGLLANNLILAGLVPAVALAVLVVHRERVGWLASVVGRVRWSILGRLLLVATLVLLVSFALGFLLPSTGTASTAGAPGSRTLLLLVVVIVVSTPLQAAAEEVGFRGYLSQAVASLLSRPVVGVGVSAVVSAVLFALAHGSQDPWLFGDRLVFGLVASWLAWRTGGLEASVALHVANNMVSLLFSAATGTLSDNLSASTLDWRSAALDVVMLLTYAVVVDRLCRRWRPATHRLLSAEQQVGYPYRRPLTPPPAGRDDPWGMG